ISKRSFLIAGLPITVYGYNELHPQTTQFACVWLLHGRLNSQACMEPIATSLVGHWNEKWYDVANSSPLRQRGLIAVSFDQRNHGSRLVDSMANKTWLEGNETHAQDMFATYHGTSVDLSFLMDHLMLYLFPQATVEISMHAVIGVSLGGHAAWHTLFHEPRVRCAVIILGCPDFIRLMVERASQSNSSSLSSDTSQSIRNHNSLMDSKLLPQSLLNLIKRYDPAALLAGQQFLREPYFSAYPETVLNNQKYDQSAAEKLKRTLRGKSVLNISGTADELVPYRCCGPFLTALRVMIKSDGCLADEGISLHNVFLEDVGHEVTVKAVEETVNFM
ncbi:hypothetical protein BGW36DRAFT_276688, partial [Talaromyces proteolyticus]